MISEVRESLQTMCAEACEGLANCDKSQLVEAASADIHEGMDESVALDSAILAAKSLVEVEPDFSFVGARLLLRKLAQEVVGTSYIPFGLESVYDSWFHKYIAKGIAFGHIDPRLGRFNFKDLSAALRPERDQLFTHLGLQTLYDRYFLHDNGRKYELPQWFWMRIAMGLALNEHEKDPNAAAIEFYDVMSQLLYVPSTPTLFNSGTITPQLSSCFLSTVEADSIEGIFNTYSENAQLQKYAGGVANDWSEVRSSGSYIKSTNGRSSGVIPYLKIANDVAVAVDQAGKRKGAVVAYLETWHLDIEDFLELRKNTGDDRRRTHDMNIANWIPDLFMERVEHDGDWTLFSPDQVPGLHDAYGEEFKKLYQEYEYISTLGNIRSKTLKAKDLWKKMLSMLFETGHPWITFKDPCNIRSSQRHAGVVHSSNLCVEITLNTSATETAVCNLGSLNLARHVGPEGTNEELLASTVKTAVRMLDNVIDINFYPSEKARRSNLRHRPIGLGQMGMLDALYGQGISCDSEEAVRWADWMQEFISWHATHASIMLAAERGAYCSYKGSTWSQGKLPIDTVEDLREARAGVLEQDSNCSMEWDGIRDELNQYGIRNSLLQAIAPTATISNIAGVFSSIEPLFQNIWVKGNLSGDFTCVNTFLVRDLKELRLWSKDMSQRIKECDGSIQTIFEIPQWVRDRYKTAFEIDMSWLIRAASARQKWICQSQSLNLYFPKTVKGRDLDKTYKMAHLYGLKTTYYLKGQSSSDAEKSTVDTRQLNSVFAIKSTNLCSIDNEDCESCQ